VRRTIRRLSNDKTRIDLDSVSGSPIQVAGWRLDRAVARLRGRIARRLEHAEFLAEDREHLAAELNAARVRAQELEAAGAAAAAALDRAISQINDVLAEQGARV
jgi:Domain of unknown function (DUF4164)